MSSTFASRRMRTAAVYAPVGVRGPTAFELASAYVMCKLPVQSRP
jgi:hypothetical protein